jgi:signal transduction histidine kinase/CheY-like chemotaxis protein/purine-cytosine permease-like protein
VPSVQKIARIRRNYNQWVANQTLEDFALRFTASRARRWSISRITNTALGAISFLALEAIGGAITLAYGFENAVAAILAVSALIFVTGIPISYYAARYGVDVDLLSRGAGFGYIGSTITSLIYASFTFIFFAIEAAIMAGALELFLGIPLPLGYLISSVVVIPLVTHGVTFISRFQLWTQPLWLVLHMLPFAYFLLYEQELFAQWTEFTGTRDESQGGFDLLMFGAASAVIFALMAQIGEQVDFLRFLPDRRRSHPIRWWGGVLAAGPGWIILGCVKMLAGSFLAYVAFSSGVPVESASDPSHMYLLGFSRLFESPEVAVVLTLVFVVVSQLKINVTNAYAGSIAWSNFFSRLTHSHPGRVVWLVFNVAIALLLMELGIYKALEAILGLYAIVAVAWVATLASDLLINKPLGLSPPEIEFRRAYLYDVNPVGVGAMLLAIAAAAAAHLGLFGNAVGALSSFVALAVAFVAAPLIALLTGGRYYKAREPAQVDDPSRARLCCICEHTFEPPDMAQCPAYGGDICSLCCSLDARCHDGCKPNARFQEQIVAAMERLLPKAWVSQLNSRIGHYIGVMLLVALVIAAILGVVYLQAAVAPDLPRQAVAELLLKIFVIFLIVYGVAAWLFVLANESRKVAQEESNRQTELLLREIEAHSDTDRKLQLAKETAENANLAKSRYVVGLAHEFRTPLNAIYGYAQLLEKESDLPKRRVNAVSTIRRSAEHLSELINGLLDIAQIEAGRVQISRDSFHLAEFLDDLVSMFELQCRAKAIRFDYEPASPLPDFVSTDRKRLRQTLINLLTNAAKFTFEGGVTFQVRYHAQVAEFIIRDTGVGIPDDDLERIFLPFERVNSPGAHAAKGTGLGLAIARLLAEVMGGDLVLKSQVGVGTTVHLKLYLPTVRPRSVQPYNEMPIIGYEGPVKTVLVVDDETAHRGLVEDVLAPLGFDVLLAADGAACLRIAADRRPDLFLLDISMPGMNGWELAERLRQAGFTREPIVMISADASELIGSERASSPHDSYLIKPIRIAELLRTLKQLLDLTWRRADDPGSTSARPRTSPAMLAEGTRLAPRQRNELRRLCEIGHIRGIQAQLARLATEQPEAAADIERLQRHIDAFEIDQFLVLLDEADA